MLDDPYDPYMYDRYSSDEETGSIYENDDAELEQGESNTKWNTCTCTHVGTNICFYFFLFYLHTADFSLMLNLTVDDHLQRLEKLEGALVRMEMLDKSISMQNFI